MNSALITPRLDELYGFIDRVKEYPMPVDRLVNIARRSGAPSDIVGFYKSFDPAVVFANKEELVSRSEQVDIMREESADMPQEQERSPEEY